MKNKNMPEVDDFKRVINELINIKERKSGDYANSWRARGIQGMYYQIARKFSRLWINKDKSDAELNFEMMRDTLVDLAVYSIMAIQLLDSDDTSDRIDKVLKDKMK